MRCQSCGKDSPFELIDVQRKIGFQKICILCKKAEERCENRIGNWKDVPQARRVHGTEIKCR